MENNSSNPQQSGSAPVANSSNERDLASRRNRLMRITQRTIDTDDSSRSSSSSSSSSSRNRNNNNSSSSSSHSIGGHAVRDVVEQAVVGADVPNAVERSEDEESRLFEDYIREREFVGTEIYNTELPTEHAYLGKLERVEGVDYLEPGKTYRLPIYSHHSVVFPGEIVPLMLNASYLYNVGVDGSSDGLKFGLVFQDQYTTTEGIYGVTCQVYERGNEGESALLKTIAQQRFVIVRHTQERRVEVRILPEIVLPDPLVSTCSNAMVRYAFSSRKDRLRSFKCLLTQSTAWPQFVYDQYGTEEVLTKVKHYLSSLKITSVPTDPVKLSFWLARNVPLTEENRKTIFGTDSVLHRMLIINKELDHMWYYICKRCDNEITNYSDIFAMSKQGVQTSYCNPSGYVHDTLTVHKTKENSIVTLGPPSTDYSWFPGYSWQIIVCANCRQHLGWKFVATKKNFLPKSFFGLSGTSITVKSHGDQAKNVPHQHQQSDREQLQHDQPNNSSTSAPWVEHDSSIVPAVNEVDRLMLDEYESSTDDELY